MTVLSVPEHGELEKRISPVADLHLNAWALTWRLRSGVLNRISQREVERRMAAGGKETHFSMAPGNRFCKRIKGIWNACGALLYALGWGLWGVRLAKNKTPEQGRRQLRLFGITGLLLAGSWGKSGYCYCWDSFCRILCSSSLISSFSFLSCATSWL